MDDATRIKTGDLVRISVDPCKNLALVIGTDSLTGRHLVLVWVTGVDTGEEAYMDACYFERVVRL